MTIKSLIDRIFQPPVQTVYLPKGISTTKNGVEVTEFYLAGYGGFGFNYVDGYHVQAKDLGLEHDVLVLTGNSLGANQNSVTKIIDYQDSEEGPEIKVQAIGRKIYKKVLTQLGI